MKKSNKTKIELDETQIFAIYYLADSGLTPTNIAKKLSVPLKNVKDSLANREKSQSEAIQTTSSKVNSKNLMITETAGKGNNSVAIMTKAASEVNDSYKQNMDRNVCSRTAKNAIYRPNQK